MTLPPRLHHLKPSGLSAGAASLAAVTVLFSSGLLFATSAQAATAPVPLGTANGFAVFAGDAITDVPTSTIRGNVGLSPAAGSFIGVTCLEVTGTIYSVDATGPLPCRQINPGLLTTTTSDIKTAYVNADTRPATKTYAAGDNQLGGKTLVGGVYKFGHASTANLSGNLTLNGDASTVWIFQATSDLVTASDSRVTLTGGAQACNVFWQVDTAATLNTRTHFVGTILAHDDITLGDAVTVQGRLLAAAQPSSGGRVTLIHDTITRTGCAATPKPTSTPTRSRSQITQTPSGPVDTGDYTASTSGGTAGFWVAAGALLLAGLLSTVTVVARRRARNV
jgi:ice-binding like protein